MMEKLKKFFSTNIGWKILSLILAIFVWFVGMNINNPTTTQTFSMPLEMHNTYSLTTNDLILLNKKDLEEQKIDLRIRGSRNDLQELRRNITSINKPFIDFAPLDISSEKNIGTKFYTTIYKPDLGSKYEIVDNYPRTAEIMLDKEISKDLDIGLEIEGTLSSDYIMTGGIEVEPKTVHIEGASTVLDNIDRVVVYVDVTDRTESFTEEVEIFVYGKDGERITENYYINNNKANISVNILRQKKVPIIQAEIVGNLPTGYVLHDVHYSKTHLDIVGSHSEVEKVNQIVLKPIDITNRTEDFTVEKDLEKLLKEINNNVSVRNGSTTILNIDLDINEYVTKSFEIPIEQVAIKGKKEDMVLSPIFTIDIAGFKKDIENIDLSTIKASLDLRDFQDGEEGPAYINVELDEMYEIKNVPYITITRVLPIEDTTNDDTTVNENGMYNNTTESNTNYGN